MHQQLKFGIEAILAPSFSNASSPNCSDVSSSSLNTSPVSSSTAASLPPTPIPSLDSRSLLPAWIFCTRYSDRPSSGQRTRKPRKRESSSTAEEEKRPRTAFTADQLGRLKEEFRDNRYLTEKRRQELAHELRLNESQIKIWFQNKRAKLKKANGERPLSFAPFVPHNLYQRVLQP